MAEKVPQHKHCQVCGKPIPLEETLCSEECKQKYQKFMKKRKLMLYIMYAMIAAVVVLILVSA